MEENQNGKKKMRPLRRIVLEVGFIVFLFYSNLLMGEYTRTGLGYTKGLLWAIDDVCTLANFTIAIVLGLLGFLLFDYVLKRR
jgi:hypothetical protein